MSGPYFVGVDSGTQSCKAIICDLNGEVICSGTGIYEPEILPQPGWVEQDPADLWAKFCQAVHIALANFPHPKSEIAAVGLTGQRGTSPARQRRSPSP